MTDLMTATERREAFQNDGYGFAQEEDAHYWDYAAPLAGLVEAALERVEGLFGADAAAGPLFDLLEPVSRISGPATTWRQVIENDTLAFADALPVSRRLDDALLYGRYGITAEDVPVAQRLDWLEALVAEVTRFAARADVADETLDTGVFTRIANLAATRLAIDTGRGEADVPSTAILGGVTEGRVRNLMSGANSPLERGPNGGIVAMNAAAWLQKKKGYIASIWQNDAEEEDEVPDGPAIPADRMIFVPVARDGTMFTPDLMRNDAYRIGAKGEEVDIPGFEEALARLNAMPVPRWRRPNEKGIWGIVSGVSWQRIEKK